MGLRNTLVLTAGAMALATAPFAVGVSAPSGALKTAEPIVVSSSSQSQAAVVRGQSFCLPASTPLFTQRGVYTGHYIHRQLPIKGTLIGSLKGSFKVVINGPTYVGKMVYRHAKFPWVKADVKPGSCGSTTVPSGATPGGAGVGSSTVAHDANGDGVVSAFGGKIQLQPYTVLGPHRGIGANFCFDSSLPATVSINGAVLYSDSEDPDLMVPGMAKAYSYVPVTLDAYHCYTLTPVTPAANATYLRVSVDAVQTDRGVRPFTLFMSVKDILARDDSSAAPDPLGDAPPDDGTTVDPLLQEYHANPNQVILVRVNAGTLTVAKAKTAIKKAVRRQYSGARGLDVRQCTVRSATAVYCAWVGFTIPKADGTDVYTGTALATLRSNGIRVWFPAFQVRHTPFR
ncbi:hypothetical protein HY857_02555 [Candidatus Saccharibacteria bacterium]|nr:hypothetical protein [Candidatus Saccharibacteria bacterium]